MKQPNIITTTSIYNNMVDMTTIEFNDEMNQIIIDIPLEYR